MTPLQDMKRHKDNSDQLLADGFAVVPMPVQPNKRIHELYNKNEPLTEEEWEEFGPSDNECPQCFGYISEDVRYCSNCEELV